MTFLQVIISGILLGGIYSLISVGLSLLFGVLRIVNFAHGEFLMLSMFLGYWMYNLYQLDPYLSLLIVVPASAVFGWILYRILIRGVLGQSDMVYILTTVALSIVLQNLALLFFGPDERAIQTVSSSIQIGEIFISTTRLIGFIGSILLVVGLILFLKKTYLGKAIMAVAQDKRAASYVGINVDKVYMITFILSVMCVGVAGSLILPIFSVSPHIGTYLVLIAFVVVVIGGLGNINGVIPGGILIGVVEALSGYYLSVSWKEIIYFIIFLLVLSLRPAGLFGKKGSEVVGH